MVQLLSKLQPADWLFVLAALTLLGNLGIAFIPKRPSGDARLAASTSREASLVSENRDLHDELDATKERYDELREKYFDIVQQNSLTKSSYDSLKAKEVAWTESKEAWAKEKQALGRRIRDKDEEISRLSRAALGASPPDPKENGNGNGNGHKE